ncbi:MAG TPA: hypothetical protein VK599_18345, partial [Streptosporangiaceae bacterium]|nr:hypothetical protein [Streptosporangiaceae bacterium]
RDLKYGLPLEARARHVFAAGDIAQIVLDWSIDGTGPDGEHVHVEGSASDVAGHEHMARLGLQRQAESEIALEFGSDLGAISDGSPVIRDEHGLRVVQAHHRADPAGVESLTQRRGDAFGLCGD